MADLSPEQINKLITALESIPPSLTELKDQLGKSVKKELDYNQRLKKSAEDVKARFENLKKQLEANLITEEEYKKATKDLANSSKELAVVNSDVKAKVKEFGTGVDKVSEGLGKATKGIGDFTTAAIKHTTDIARSVQTSTKGYQLAGDLVTKGADLTSSALTGAGSMATAGGQALSAMGGKAGKAGKALEVIGLVGGFLGSTVKALTPAFDLLINQLRIVTDGYDKSVAAGAIFAGSYGGFAKSAAGAGLSIQQFGDFLSKNNSVLAQTGIGIAQAAQRVGAVGKILKDSGTDVKLQKLGYGFEEQAELTARVMADMNRAGRDIREVSSGEIAVSTEKYATNLRVLAAITGDDAKKRQDEARAANMNLATLAKTRQMELAGDKNATDRFRNIVAAAPKDLQKLTREIITYGKPMSVETARQLAAMGAAGKGFEQSLKGLAEDSSKSGDDATAAMGDIRATLKEGMMDNLDQLKIFGQALDLGSTSVGGLGKTFEGVLNELSTAGKGGGDQAKKDAEAAKVANDNLTNGIVASNNALQALKLQLDKQTLPILGTFASEIGKASQALVDFVTKVGDQSTGATVAAGIVSAVTGGLLSVFGPAFGEMLINKIGKSLNSSGGAGGAGAAGGGGGASGPLLDKNGNPLKGAALKSVEDKMAREAAKQAEEATAKKAAQTAGAKVLSRAGGAVVGGAFEAYQSYGEYQDAEEKRKRGEISESEADKKKTEAVAGGVGGTGGALAGAAMGAMYGALLGPIGAVVGGLVGGAVGAIGGRAASEKIAGVGYDVVKGAPKPVGGAQTVNADAARNPDGTPGAMPTPDPAAAAAEAAKAQAAASIATSTPTSEQRRDPMELLIARVAGMQDQLIQSNMYLKDIRGYTEKTAQRVG